MMDEGYLVRGDVNLTSDDYAYRPFLVAAIIFSVVFTLATIFGFYQFVVAWIKVHSTSSNNCDIYCVIPYLLGGICEVAAYILRALNHSKTTVELYLVQNLLLFVAPPLFAGTIYLTLGRVARIFRYEMYSLITIKWLDIILITGAIVSFLVELVGCSLRVTSTEASTPIYIIFTGLFVQIFFLVFFVIVAMILHIKVTRYSSSGGVDSKPLTSRFRNWNSILISLSLCSSLILIRSIMRVVEFLQGSGGYIVSHEYFIYIFDSLFIFLNMVIFLSQDTGKCFVDLN